MNISLFIAQGSEKGKSFSISANEVSIGRDPNNEVSIVDQEISRFHCRAKIVSDGITIVDNNSSNGTYVNEVRVKSCLLAKGDIVRIGQTKLLIGQGPEFSTSVLEDDDDELSTFIDWQDDFDASVILGSSTLQSSKETLNSERRFIQVQNDLRFIYKASRVTSRRREKLQMLSELLDLIFEWVAADRGCVLLKAPETEGYSIQLVNNRAAGKDRSIQICESIVAHVIDQKVGVLSGNPSDKVRQTESDPENQINEVMCVPIQAEGDLLGVFYVDTLESSSSSQVSRFQKEHLRLMLSIANQAAVVIENEAYVSKLVEQGRLSAVGETTALLSHQINNILQGINGGQHLLETGLEKGDLNLVSQGWSVVERNQARVSQMMLDLIFLTKPFQPDRVRCDLVQLVKRAILQVREEDEYDVSISFQTTTASRFCEISETDIRKSIAYLLSLASKATRRDGVSVSLDVIDNNAILNVHFVGAEIFNKPQDLESEIHDSTTRQFGGIEFALSTKLVEGHGGQIELSQPAIGENLLVLTLPLSPSEK